MESRGGKAMEMRWLWWGRENNRNVVVVEEGKVWKCGGGGSGVGGGKTIEMWWRWWWRGNNRNVVAVVVVGGGTIQMWWWREYKRSVVAVVVEVVEGNNRNVVVVEGKQLKCGGGGRKKTIEMWWCWWRENNWNVVAVVLGESVYILLLRSWHELVLFCLRKIL